ncbi:MAG: hypothetical protein ACXWNJ_01705 [Vulcanimicrobiaceae bacterium]
MTFDMLDGYLLDERPSKGEVVRTLLKNRTDVPGAAPFYAGLESLGSKTADLALIALRLVLAGKKAEDATVIRIRSLIERTRAKGIDEASSREAYYRELS